MKNLAITTALGSHFSGLGELRNCLLVLLCLAASRQLMRFHQYVEH